MSKESDQAQKEIPTRWFERRWTHVAIPVITGFIFCLNNETMTPFSNNHELLAIRVLAAIAYIVGTVGDDYTTRKTLTTMSEASRIGINYDIKEHNPLLPDVPTMEKFTNPLGIHRLISTTMAGVAITLPPIGFGWAIGRGLYTLNNARAQRRLERQIELTTSTTRSK